MSDEEIIIGKIDDEDDIEIIESSFIIDEIPKDNVYARYSFLPLREEKELHSKKGKGSWYMSGNNMRTPYEYIEKKRSGLWFSRKGKDFIATTKWGHILILNPDASILTLSDKNRKNTVVLMNRNLYKNTPFIFMFGSYNSVNATDNYIFGPLGSNDPLLGRKIVKGNEQTVDVLSLVKTFELGCLFPEIRKVPEYKSIIDTVKDRPWAALGGFVGLSVSAGYDRYKTSEKREKCPHCKVCQIGFSNINDAKLFHSYFLLNTEKAWNDLLKNKPTYYKCNTESRQCEISNNIIDYPNIEDCEHDCKNKPWWVCTTTGSSCAPAYVGERHAVEDKNQCEKGCKRLTPEDENYSCVKNKCMPELNGKYKNKSECVKKCGKNDFELDSLLKNPIFIIILAIVIVLIIIITMVSFYTGRIPLGLILLILDILIIGFVIYYYIILKKIKNSLLGKLF